jgi:P27 family predicted phage terminase small subunit
MMARGQRPIPTEVHKQRGSYRASRHGARRAGEPKPTDNLQGVPPPGLSAHQRAEWNHQVRYFPAGVIKEADRHWLKLWVQAVERLDLANAALQRENDAHPDHPFQIADDKGNWHMSPLINVIAKAEMTMARASAELGFSPAARTRIRAVGGNVGTGSEAPAKEWGVKLVA